MKTTTTQPAIETTLQTRYGVNAKDADALTIEWAATHLAETIGVPAAARAWRALNRERERMGRHTTIPAWGTPMFDAFFAA